MKLEKLPEIMLTVIVTLVGLLLAIYFGSTIGSGNSRTPLMIIGAMCVMAIALTMKERIWVLIFLTGGIPGRLMFLPLSLTVKEAGALMAFSGFLILFAFKRIKTKVQYGFLDVVALINVVYIALAYVRNPVGTLIMETDRIGGRPYFTLAIGICSYFVLTRATTSLKMMRWLPLFNLAGTAIHTLIGALNFFLPSTVPLMARFYGGLTLSTYEESNAEDGGGESAGLRRMGFTKNFAENGLTALYSYFRPMTLLNPMFPKRCAMASALFLALMLSGFRSALIGTALAFFIASIFYRRFRDIAIASMMVGVAAMALVFMQGRIIELPLSVQRSLSFLPGKWDQSAIEDAEGSKEWRTDMWKIMLTEERYLKNKWLGDGFGYSLVDYQANLATASRDPEVNKEAFMIIGEVHSGPVSAIRFMGYIGLALYLWLGILNGIEWSRLIRRAYQTPIFPAALFFGISPIMSPFFFIFIFGAYDSAVASTIASIGVLHFVRRGLNQYLDERKALTQADERLPERIRINLPGASI